MALNARLVVAMQVGGVRLGRSGVTVLAVVRSNTKLGSQLYQILARKLSP